MKASEKLLLAATWVATLALAWYVGRSQGFDAGSKVGSRVALNTIVDTLAEYVEDPDIAKVTIPNWDGDRRVTVGVAPIPQAGGE